ncbi:GNAT family N-acetyltransferase [Photobacterium profundum]|uniref:GNAT family N-acetyltransferase n=1 Tax=Photobacterium profundum TaxID=74109 RepID=UPI003D1098DD
MLNHKNIVLRKVQKSEFELLYALITQDEKWTKYNGPYFPYSTPSKLEFESGLFKRLCEGDKTLAVEVDGNLVGNVSYYWECESTHWLEIGIVIYDSNYWSNGIGRNALIPWINCLFDTLEIERVGLTTWSGNPRMMACAKNLGLKQEARLRKVRYHQGVYYDSVKYGVLRSEWLASK